MRNTLATLKWDIMETYGSTTRETLLCGQAPDEYWYKHIEVYIAKQTVYEREEEDHAHFIDRADIEHKAVSHHLERIMPSLKTAFLFSKRLT